MQNKDDLMDDSVPSEIHSDPQEQDEETWLHVILGIPYVGEFLTFIIAMLPAILLVTVVMLVFNTESDTVINWVMLFSLPITYFWLRFLERKARLAICLPVPILNIRIKWLLLPVGLFVFYSLVTGKPL